LEQSLLQSKSDSASLSSVSVVIPCYNEDSIAVTQTYHELTALGAEVIVVDDGDTMELEIPHIRHYPNMGYGYAIKRGIEKATRPLILTMDGDGEHTVLDAQKLTVVFELITDCDMLVGCRWNKKEKAIRWIGRKAINFLAVCWSRHMLPDLNSGMRVFRKELALDYKPILCDTFSFTTSLTMSLVTDGHNVAWFPIDTKPRNYGTSHVRIVRDGLITVFFIFWIGFALRTRKLRGFLRRFYRG